MKALKAYNTEVLNRFLKRQVHHTDVVEYPQVDLLEPSELVSGPSDLPEAALDILEDPITNFVNSHCHNAEDIDLALQAYQAYQAPISQDPTMSPERSTNQHLTYHIAQASQATHGSLIKRGANHGLAGSDVTDPLEDALSLV